MSQESIAFFLCHLLTKHNWHQCSRVRSQLPCFVKKVFASNRTQSSHVKHPHLLSHFSDDGALLLMHSFITNKNVLTSWAVWGHCWAWLAGWPVTANKDVLRQSCGLICTASLVRVWFWLKSPQLSTSWRENISIINFSLCLPSPSPSGRLVRTCVFVQREQNRIIAFHPDWKKNNVCWTQDFLTFLNKGKKLGHKKQGLLLEVEMPEVWVNAPLEVRSSQVSSSRDLTGLHLGGKIPYQPLETLQIPRGWS